MESDSVVLSKKATVMTWAQVEAQLDQLRNKKTDFLERDDGTPDENCGKWYYDAKEDVGKDVFIPGNLVQIYAVLLNFVYFSVGYWCFLVFFIPIFGMHGIDKYVSHDMRIHYLFYWIFQPFYFVSYVFTLGKITLDRTRQSIIIGIVNFTWHIIHITLSYSLKSDRQDIYKLVHTVLHFIELFFNLILILLTVFLSVKLNELIQMIQQTKNRVKPELINMTIKNDESGMGIVYEQQADDDPNNGNNGLNKTKLPRQDNSAEKSLNGNQHGDEYADDLSNMGVPDQAIKTPSGQNQNIENRFIFQQLEESHFKTNIQDQQSQFKDRLEFKPGGGAEEQNEYQKMKSLLKQNDKRKKWGKATSKNYDDIQELELKKMQKDITQLIEN